MPICKAFLPKVLGYLELPNTGSLVAGPVFPLKSDLELVNLLNRRSVLFVQHAGFLYRRGDRVQRWAFASRT